VVVVSTVLDALITGGRASRRPRASGHPDGDGRFDGVNGDGQADFAGVVALAFVDWASLAPEQVAALDFDGNGVVDFADVITPAFV
jgi:hypothetical protein